MKKDRQVDLMSEFLFLQMEQIKRANRLYTNDSIFLKKSLYIPVLSDSGKGRPLTQEDSEGDSSSVCSQNGNAAKSSEKEATGRASELSPVDFLKRMDGLISVSKQAAVKGCEEAEKRFDGSVCRALCVQLVIRVGLRGLTF